MVNWYHSLLRCCSNLFMFNINSRCQPKDPCDGSNDGNGKRKPDCYNCKESIKGKCKISVFTVLPNAY